ncbi:hypothetical protein ANO11243_047710 [Dothideomycetidae sp. 11243]|nr:hypothetical protein ANO11243_047710 [fungal sp. No.11243]
MLEEETFAAITPPLSTSYGGNSARQWLASADVPMDLATSGEEALYQTRAVWTLVFGSKVRAASFLMAMIKPLVTIRCYCTERSPMMQIAMIRQIEACLEAEIRRRRCIQTGQTDKQTDSNVYFTDSPSHHSGHMLPGKGYRTSHRRARQKRVVLEKSLPTWQFVIMRHRPLGKFAGSNKVGL